MLSQAAVGQQCSKQARYGCVPKPSLAVSGPHPPTLALDETISCGQEVGLTASQVPSNTDNVNAATYTDATGRLQGAVNISPSTSSADRDGICSVVDDDRVKLSHVDHHAILNATCSAAMVAAALDCNT